MDKLRITSIASLLLIFLALRFFFFYQNQPHYTDGQYVNFETTLFSEPKIFGNYQTLSANLGTSNKILIKTNLYPKFHYQDTVSISGYIHEQTLNVPGKIKFKVLENKRTLTMIYFPKIEAVKKDKNLLLSLASFVRQNVILLFSKTLPEPSSSLLLGIVFGIKESMPKDFENNLRTSGVLHVVAASGMNISMIGAFASSIFAFFFKRQAALVASILIIIFYAFLAGLEPSILRAAIMGVLAFSGQILGKQNLAFYGLFIAAYSMLFYSPMLLLDVGFQLSFLATLGLLYIKPILNRGQRFGLMLRKLALGDDIVTTFSAQISTLPVLLINFGFYSLWSILVNVLILWTIPFLMVIGGIGAILGFFIEPLGKLILYLALPFLLYFELIVSLFAGWGAVVNFEDIPWQMIVAYYCILLSVILFFQKRNR